MERESIEHAMEEFHSALALSQAGQGECSLPGWCLLLPLTLDELQLLQAT